MQKFIARQPILDARERTFGYELLFRSGTESCFQSDDPDQASSSVVVDSFHLFGLEALTGGLPAFINFTHNLLVKRYPTFMPANRIVIEILEAVQPDAEVISACRALRQMGYRFALDDFNYTPDHRPLVDLADFIKVDMLASSREKQKRMAHLFGGRSIGMVAEKVETREDFREALGMGYRYFQGYFFSRPQTFSRQEIPPFKLNYMRLLKAVQVSGPDFAEIEEVIKSEPSICFRLLRYLNSAMFGFRQEIRSIRHALSLLGVKELRRWISLITLAGLCEDKPPVLVINSVVRGRFCELLARPAGMAGRSMELFLAGLLSLIDAILDCPMPDILGNLSLSDDLRMTLMGEGSGKLRDALDLVIAFEKGDWDRITTLAQRLRLEEQEIADMHLRAVEWGNQIFRMDRFALAS